MLPYLLLCREDSGHREHDLREVFNTVRYVAKTGCPWRWVPGDLPPWAAVYQQMRRWLPVGCFEALVADVQLILREWAGKKGQPTAVCLDTLTDDVAEHFAGDDENNQQTAEEILLSAIDSCTDEGLTGFAVRLALTGHVAVPRESDFDFLTEAESAFIPRPPAREKKPKKASVAIKVLTKKGATRKKVAA